MKLHAVFFVPAHCPIIFLLLLLFFWTRGTMFVCPCGASPGLDSQPDGELVVHCPCFCPFRIATKLAFKRATSFVYYTPTARWTTVLKRSPATRWLRNETIAGHVTLLLIIQRFSLARPSHRGSRFGPGFKFAISYLEVAPKCPICEYAVMVHRRCTMLAFLLSHHILVCMFFVV